MKIELRNEIGVNILLEQAAISRIDASLRGPSGEVIDSSDTAPLLRVDEAMVESVHRLRGALSMTVELSNTDFGFGLLAMRSEDHIALLLFDLARHDVLGWLDAAEQRNYLPVVLMAGERAVQVRLPVDSHVRELREAGHQHRSADKDEQFTAFSLMLDLLENIEFLGQLDIDPKTVGLVNLLVLTPMDTSCPRATKPNRDERTNSMH